METLSPTSIPGTVFWGVVAGTLTSAFLVICGAAVSKIIIPWYQRLVYRGIDLSGSWEQTFEEKGATYRYDTSLRQSAHLLRGTATYSKSGTDDDYVQSFKISGCTWDGFVLLNLESSDRARLSFGTALFKIYDIGERLTGFLAYRGRRTDEVEYWPLEWKRRR